MATKVLPGGIIQGIRNIEEPESVQILVSSRPKLICIENGDPRALPISREVAEVLIAMGFAYGN